MGDEVDSNTIKSTQNSLGKYVKRPPLSDKLLKKPPFRFIHDIITSVLKTTRFFNGLFEEHELQSENVKDRESKILFLNKIIYVVGTTLGKTLTVKPSKVIAGQEPEKTNELLQCIALALDKKLSSDEAVEQYKKSVTKPASSETKLKVVKKVTKDNNNVNLSSKSVTKTDSNIIVKTNPRDVKKKESPPKKASLRSTSKKPAEKSKSDENNIKSISRVSQDQPIGDNEEIPKIVEEKSAQNKELPQLLNTTVETEENINLIKSIPNSNLNNQYVEDIIKIKDTHEPRIELESKSFGSDSEINVVENTSGKNEDKIEGTDSNINEERNQENNLINRNNVSTLSRHTVFRENSFEAVANETKIPDDTKVIRPLSVRPPSSRPGAPRLREKHEETITDTDNLLIGKVNIIAENTVQEEDEETSIVIVENDISNSEVDEEFAQIDAQEHGHLVQQILNSQKEFSQVSGKTEIEWQFGAKKARDVINQEIDQLRFNLQALSRVANPLGKLLDHIQEDVEVMRQELHHWTKTYEDAHKELRKQKKSNDDKLKPLHSKIKLLDAEINEKQDKINDLKITIHKNALRIDKLLANGNKQ